MHVELNCLSREHFHRPVKKICMNCWAAVADGVLKWGHRSSRGSHGSFPVVGNNKRRKNGRKCVLLRRRERLAAALVVHADHNGVYAREMEPWPTVIGGLVGLRHDCCLMAQPITGDERNGSVTWAVSSTPHFTIIDSKS